VGNANVRLCNYANITPFLRNPIHTTHCVSSSYPSVDSVLVMGEGFLSKQPSVLPRVLCASQCPPHNVLHETYEYPLYYDPFYIITLCSRPNKTKHCQLVFLTCSDFACCATTGTFKLCSVFIVFFLSVISLSFCLDVHITANICKRWHMGNACRIGPSSSAYLVNA
jgi:hypothetical protein